jgi:hypothetical protein
MSPRRPGFDPGLHMGCVVDKVALGQVFPPSTSVFSLSGSFHRCSITWNNEKTNNLGCDASVASAAGPFTKKKDR